MPAETRTKEMDLHTASPSSSHSRENGNPESFPYLDSRLRGSDNFFFRVKPSGFDHPRMGP